MCVCARARARACLCLTKQDFRLLMTPPHTARHPSTDGRSIYEYLPPQVGVRDGAAGCAAAIRTRIPCERWRRRGRPARGHPSDLRPGRRRPDFAAAKGLWMELWSCRRVRSPVGTSRYACWTAELGGACALFADHHLPCKPCSTRPSFVLTPPHTAKETMRARRGSGRFSPRQQSATCPSPAKHACY